MRLIVCIFAFVALAQGQTTPPAPTPSDDFECPDREEAFYSHPTDCSAYYHCTNGLAWYRQCSEGLYFNPATSVCDYPWNVDCENAPTSPQPDPNPKPTADPALRGVSIIDPSPDYECDPEDNGAFPHEESCELYYDCYEGIATLFTCTDIQLFDLVYNGCNWAQDVDCGNRTRPGGFPTQKTTTTKKPGVTPEVPFDCPEPEGLFEDPEDCAAYYQCYAGTSWHHYCSVNLYFNPVNDVCDYLAQVDCGDRPIHTTHMEDTVIRMIQNRGKDTQED